MDFPKYDGNIHPDEWINEIQKYVSFWKGDDAKTLNRYLNFAILSVDSTIKLPDGIDDFEKLRKSLKEDVSFTVFKNMNKRKLRSSLKYIPEKKGGDTSEFISKFRKLCYNAEIDDVEEQKKYLYQSLPDEKYYNEVVFFNLNVNSIDELIKEFEEIVIDESNLIRNGSIVALKHVATGKYLSSIENLLYTTGSKTQLVFIGSTGFDLNSLWKISFSNELATYSNTVIYLQHIKSNNYLGININSSDYDYTYGRYNYCKSPLTEHTEVSCNANDRSWKFYHSKLENYQGYLKSNDIINLSNIRQSYSNDEYEYLRSHDIQFTIGNDTFQEVVCHNGRLGGNDEWCIELIKQV